MQNPFVWHDLMTPDVEAAKKFYASIVGWTYETQSPEYQVTLVGGLGTGGIMVTPDHLKAMPPMWGGYIYTPDVDAACKKIVKLGGAIKREPWDIPGMLRMAVVADPHGAFFNIMQPLSQEERKLPKVGVQGTVGWNELHAGDLKTAWNFYSELFGWTKGTAMDMGAMGLYQIFQINGKDAGAMMKRQDSPPFPMWLYYFNVDGIDAAVTRINNGGGKVVMGPHEVPGNQWIVSAIDSQGGSFQLVSSTK
jgi:predicted enzyme related to lactoylglutathione lyase